MKSFNGRKPMTEDSLKFIDGCLPSTVAADECHIVITITQVVSAKGQVFPFGSEVQMCFY